MEGMEDGKVSVPTGLRGWNPSTVYTMASRLFARTVRTVRNPKRFKVRYVNDLGVSLIEEAKSILHLVNRVSASGMAKEDWKAMRGLLMDYRCDLNSAYLSFGMGARGLSILDEMAEELGTCLRRIFRGRAASGCKTELLTFPMATTFTM